jgi:ditrans,polycis-polyprenyl diphosphate synthase
MRQRGDIIERHHICIRVLGDVTLLPDYLQNSLAKCVSMSKHNSGYSLVHFDEFGRYVVSTISSWNGSTILNICIAYTSHQEFERSAAELIDGLERNEIKPTYVLFFRVSFYVFVFNHQVCLSVSDITDELFQRCMYTEDCPLPDLLIRTSGETRLSDFLLYQANHTRLCFLPSLWPELRYSDQYISYLLGSNIFVIQFVRIQFMGLGSMCAELAATPSGC